MWRHGMEVIIVKADSNCFRKCLSNLTNEAEECLRSSLHILSNPFSFGYSDIQTGSQLKPIAAKFSADAEMMSCNALKGVMQQINALGDTDEVVLLDAERYSNYDILCWSNALWGKLENHNPVEVYHYMQFDLPQKKFPRHDILFFADLGFEQYFGEPDKSKRVCRFCNGTGPEIFGDKKNSHAISWFLGNDALFCLEECKTCNNTFGHTIENALSSYYQYYRAAEHRKSRKGNPITAKGFNYETLTDCGLRYYATGPIDNALKVGDRIPKDGILIHLNNKEPVVLHDIYRVLVKYVVACVPNEMLPAFQTTVKWIRGEKRPSKGTLPPVYRIETLEEVQKPSLCIYVRKDNKKDLPYCVGELRFMENLYVFAVPYCKGRDVTNPYLAEPLSRFVKQRYPDTTFTIENFCDYEQKMIVNHVKIEGDENTVLMPLHPLQ